LRVAGLLAQGFLFFNDAPGNIYLAEQLGRVKGLLDKIVAPAS
jgi:hypothetical protein